VKTFKEAEIFFSGLQAQGHVPGCLPPVHPGLDLPDKVLRSFLGVPSHLQDLFFLQAPLGRDRGRPRIPGTRLSRSLKTRSSRHIEIVRTAPQVRQIRLVPHSAGFSQA